MVNRNSNIYRGVLLVGVLVVLGVVGYMGYRWYQQREENADILKISQDLYNDGKKALEGNELVRAQNLLTDANTSITKGLDLIEEEKKKTKAPTEEQKLKWTAQHGQLLYLKSLTLRDQAFTKGLINGEPLKETEDTVTRERFRSVQAIPTTPSDQVWKEAVESLRVAAEELPRDQAVLNDALRAEVMFDPPNWIAVERLSQKILVLDPSNVRANWWLAKLEYDQPRDGTADLPELKKRSPERMQRAREHLQKIKSAPVFPVWRTLYLDAQINRWILRDSPVAVRDRAKSDESQFHDVFFEPKNGALARAARKEEFSILGRPDIEGLLHLHLMAVDLGIEQVRASSDRTEDLLLAVKSLVNLASDLSSNTYATRYRGEIFEVCTITASKARRVLGARTIPEWSAIRVDLENLAQQMADAGVSRPQGYAALALLLNHEAFLERNRDETLRKQLEEKALKWVDQGLKLAADAKEPSSATVDLRAVALEVLTGRSDGQVAIDVHLGALRQVNNERAAGIVALHESAASVRQGKLTKARSTLEDVVKITKKELSRLRPNQKDDGQRSASTEAQREALRSQLESMNNRALTLLAHVNLATDKATDALADLVELERAYGRIDELSPLERDWMKEFLRDADELAFLTVIGELEKAVKKIQLYRKNNPGKSVPEQETQNEENRARDYIKKLAVKKPANLRARSTLVQYYIRTGQIKKAEATVTEMKKDYPNEVDVLRLEVALALLPPRGVKDDAEALARRMTNGDRMIQEFMGKNPEDVATKRFWVEWLIRTGRQQEAITYLENPQNFGERDDATKKMLAIALLNQGNNEQGLKLLRDLPKDRSIEQLIIYATTNPVVRQDLLKNAIGKHDDAGQFRIWEGERLFAEGKYAEAARYFWQTMEYTRVARAAEDGFIRSALKIAETAPDQAFQLIEEFKPDSPDNPMLYSVAAYAAIYKDDLGSPTDVWGPQRSMYAALKAYANGALARGMDNQAIALFKANIFQLANRPDLAWDELVQVVPLNANNEQILGRLVQLAIYLLQDDARLAKAADYVSLIKELRKSDPVSRELEARLLARRGDYAKAAEIMEVVLLKQPDMAGWYAPLISYLLESKQPQKAAEWTVRWRNKFPDDPQPVLETIRQEIVAGKINEAKEQSTAFVIEQVAKVEKRIPKSTEPDADKRKAAALTEARVSANLALGQVWQQGGQFDTAIKYIELALKDDAKNIPGRLLKGQLLMAKKEWAKARDIYEDVLKEEKGNSVAHLNLAWLLAEHLDQPAEAVKMIKASMLNAASGKTTPVEKLSPQFLDTLGKVYLQAARKNSERHLFTEMTKIFDTASKRYPTDPRVFVHLGEAHAGMSERDLARSALQTALKLAQTGKGPITDDERKELIQRLSKRMGDL